MSVIRRFIGSESDFNWEDTELTDYTGVGSIKDATKRILISEDKDGAKNYVFRYFRVLPGGNSTMLDQHAHDHGVLILHGHARVLCNGEEHHVGPMDVIYVSPDDVHHFITEGDEPLGFLCVIPKIK